MKANQYREKTVDELLREEGVLREQLFRLRFQNVAGSEEHPQKKRLVRRDIARIRTVLREKARPAPETPATEGSKE